MNLEALTQDLEFIEDYKDQIKIQVAEQFQRYQEAEITPEQLTLYRRNYYLNNLLLRVTSEEITDIILSEENYRQQNDE